MIGDDDDDDDVFGFGLRSLMYCDVRMAATVSYERQTDGRENNAQI
jgi:hypothetical protein